jgi:hypothetical protein
MYSWANLNAAGTTKRVVTTAALFMGQCIGNVSFDPYFGLTIQG